MTLNQGPGRGGRLFRVAVCAGIAAVLAACGSSPRAPVENRSTGGISIPRVDPATLPGYEFRNRPGYYQVQPGETIRSIARNNNLDWRDIVRWNSQWVPNPDLIEVGQVLRVIAPVAAERPRPATAAGTTRAPALAASAAPGTAEGVAPSPAPPPGAAAAASDDQPGFIWPASGTLLAGFDEARNKGFDISGKAGDPVLAAADGRVVYAGAGLRGYGNLIILKHNNIFLTAYAHNQTLLVKEDQAVRKGQKIAEMGSTDTDRVKLHFEVRRQGKPVDPARYLPAR